MIIGAELNILGMFGGTLGTISLIVAGLGLGAVITIFVTGFFTGAIPFFTKYPLDVLVWRLRAGQIIKPIMRKARPYMGNDGYERIGLKQGFLKRDIPLPNINYDSIPGNNVLHLFSSARGDYKIAKFGLKVDAKGNAIGEIEPIASQSDKIALANSYKANLDAFEKKSWLAAIAPFVTIAVTAIFCGLMIYFALMPMVEFAETWATAGDSWALASQNMGEMFNSLVTANAGNPPPT